MDWEKGTLIDAIPSAITTIAGTITTLSGTVSTVLETAETVLDSAALFLTDGINPVLLGVQAGCDAALDEINNLRGNGLYMLSILPQTPGSRSIYNRELGFWTLPPSRLLSVLSNAFEDSGDENAPPFSESAVVGGEIFLFGARDPLAFAELLGVVGGFFNLARFKRMEKRLRRVFDPAAATPLRPIPPDFVKSSIMQFFPEVDQALKRSASAVEGIKGKGTGASASIQILVSQLKREKKNLEEINRLMIDAVAMFNAGLSATGFYRLSVPPQAGGLEVLKTAIRSAGNKPPDELLITGGLCLVGGANELIWFQS